MAAAAAAAYRVGFAGILEPLVLVTYDLAYFRAFRRDAALADGRRGRRRGPWLRKTTGEHLDMLFVQPRAHGGGAGSALLAEAEGRGIRTLECFRDNTAARSFYEKRGWRLLRGYVREFAGKTRAFVYYGKP